MYFIGGKTKAKKFMVWSIMVCLLPAAILLVWKINLKILRMKILHEIWIQAGLGVLGENRDGCSGIRTRHLGNKIRPCVAQFALWFVKKPVWPQLTDLLSTPELDDRQLTSFLYNYIKSYGCKIKAGNIFCSPDACILKDLFRVGA